MTSHYYTFAWNGSTDWVWNQYAITNVGPPITSGSFSIATPTSLPPGWVAVGSIGTFTGYAGGVYGGDQNGGLGYQVIAFSVQPAFNSFAPDFNGSLVTGDIFTISGCSTYDPIGCSAYDPASFNQITSAGTWLFTGSGWQQVPIPCIHADMIIDSISKPISKCDHIDDKNFSRILTLGYESNFICIKKDSLGNGLPTNDLMLTRGHPIILNGKEVECETLVNGDTIINVNIGIPVKIYGIEFLNNDRKSIKMHGVDVMQWGDRDFMQYQTNTGTKYIHNVGLRKYSHNKQKINQRSV
jgi:hypothetical protein